MLTMMIMVMMMMMMLLLCVNRRSSHGPIIILLWSLREIWHKCCSTIAQDKITRVSRNL